MQNAADGAGTELQHGMDRLVIHGRRVFGWGWVADRKRGIARVDLEAAGEGWEGRVPASAGLERPDVERTFPGWRNAAASGFVVTGFLPHDSPRRLLLAVTFDDGETARLDVTRAAEERSGGKSQRRMLGWLLRAVWRRLRRGDVKGILQRMRSQNYGAPHVGEANVASAILPLLGDRPVSIVFDHNMGGGANHYRRKVVAGRIEEGRAVVLCTYNLPTLDYRLVVSAPGLAETVFRVPSFTVLEPLLGQARVAELFLNSPVSFDEPLMLAEWLTRMREQHASARLVFTAHDYFSACPSFVLLDADLRHCGVPDVSECTPCLRRHTASFVSLSPPSEIGPWRALWGKCLRAADEVRCFSEASRDLLLRAYPGLPRERISVVPHPVEFFPARLPRIEPSAPLVIGVMGQISVQKGAHVVRDLVRLIEERRLPARVVVLGTLDVAMQSESLRITGAYRQEELVDRIEAHGVNVFLFPSIWPETFSYVVAEMMALRMPIVAFDLGAPAERLRGYPAARLVRDVSAEAALESLLELHGAGMPTPAAGGPRLSVLGGGRG